MNRQDYKDEAVRLLKRAENSLASGFSNNAVEDLTDIARVYAMLAAIPEEQGDAGTNSTLTDIKNFGVGDVSDRVGR